ncbi:MAG: hypothetical protein WC889_18805, partial [Myxococcota bacterium]
GCAPCGHAGEPCCDVGDLCSTGEQCDNGTCVKCGAEAENCCSAEPFCWSAENSCQTGGEMGPMCWHCGLAENSEPCCAGGKCTEANSACITRYETSTCMFCGEVDQPCCTDNKCSGQLGCSWEYIGGMNEYTCKECGFDGQACCKDSSYSPFCNEDMTRCNGEVCTNACGGTGEYCCQGNLCKGTDVCGDGRCMVCGQDFNPCCAAEPYCSTPGATCSEGYCQPPPPDGGVY